MKLRFFGLISLILLCVALIPVSAQEYTEQQVIDMTTSFVPFSYGLQTVPGWKAAAYNTGNVYGIWRVQFWSSDGEEIAWANIAPAQKRLYNYEAPFGSTEEQRNAAEPLVRAYIQSHPDVIALLGDPMAYNDATYVEYNGWVKAWGVWIERGDDSVYILVQFKGQTPDSLTEPQLLEIGFPNIPSYADWQTNQQDEVKTIAFTQPEVAAALRDVTGWQAEAVRQDDGLWNVTFSAGETKIVSALVKLDTRETLKWTIP